MNYILNAYCLQDIGKRETQEDRFFPPFIDPCSSDDISRDWSFYDGRPHTDDRLFILCDGMGGHDRGEIAAQVVVQTMSKTITESAPIEGDFSDAMLRYAVDEALDALEALDDPLEVRKMGTTMTVLKFHAAGATIGHIGDSRVYHFRPASTGKNSNATKDLQEDHSDRDTQGSRSTKSGKSRKAAVLFRTDDHTMANFLVHSGAMTPAQALTSPKRHVLTRSMTCCKDFRPEVEIAHIKDIQPGDVFLLCSDGMYETLDDEQLCDILTNPNYSGAQCAEELLKASADSHDNHTAIIVKVKDIINGGKGDKGSDEALSPGTVLKSKDYTYHIERVIGRGSFGLTYLVSTDVTMQGPLGAIHTDVKVAMKEFYMHGVMHRGDNGSVVMTAEDEVKKYAEKFRSEALKLSRIIHPNVVRVMDVFEANNTYYYTMEYLQGGSLHTYVTKKGGLPEQEAIACIRQIGSALNHMHANKMLHLDMKPSNIMIQQDADADAKSKNANDLCPGTLKIIDFGLTKIYNPDGEAMTSSIIGYGTEGYAPLEQSDTTLEQAFSPQLDVYGLGATYYKLLTAVNPPSAVSVLNQGLPTMPLVKKNVSQQSIDAIKAAMEPVQEKRLKTVNDFLNMLPRVDDTTLFPEKKQHSFWRWLLPVIILAAVAVAVWLAI